MLAVTRVLPGDVKNGGPDRDRTGDLMNAIHARSQLRYRPTRVGTNYECNTTDYDDGSA